ncbi:MAG: class A beta-lactamase-related serine hydrolase [Alicyclobacillus sp.]|nr:class A beta-lactamase-related serine hydrolase [Alicyclobacillus sp.]
MKQRRKLNITWAAVSALGYLWMEAMSIQANVAVRKAAFIDQAGGTVATSSAVKSSPSDAQVRTASKRRNAAMDAAIRRYLATRQDQVGIAVLNDADGSLYTYNGELTFRTASTIKVAILVNALHRHLLRTKLKPLAVAMMEESDNDAATDLWHIVGDDNLNQMFKVLGMTHSEANEEGYWGLSRTTAADEIKLLKVVADPNRYLSDAERKYVLSLMEHVEPDQDWGVSSGVHDATVALKDGWSPYVPTNWRINSIGIVRGDGRNYLIAVYTFRNPTMSYGVQTVDEVSRIVWAYEKE